MNKKLLFLLACFLLIGWDNLAFPFGAGDILERNRQAIVHITVKENIGVAGSKPSYGTGFIVSTDGYVLTAKHNVASFVNSTATPISVKIGSSLNPVDIPADIISTDSGQDIALLKLVTPTSVGLTAYRAVQRGDQKKSAMGDSIFLLGFNFTSNISVEPGTISGTMGGGVCGATCWEISAPGAVFGMSGAPVFTSNGTVVGMIVGGQESTSILYVLPEQLLSSQSVTADWTRVPQAVVTASGNASVMDGNVNYGKSGFSFASNEIVAWNSPKADILVANPNKSPASTALFFLPFDAPPYVSPDDVGAESGIQAQASSASGAESVCPQTGYSYHYFTPQVNESYCVRTRAGKSIVKIVVKGVYSDRIVFDWEAEK